MPSKITKVKPAIIDIKRFYLVDGIPIKGKCKECNSLVVDTLCGDNLDYPFVNKWFDYSAWCPVCENTVDIPIKINLNLETKQ